MEPLRTLVSQSTDTETILHNYLPDPTRVFLANYTYVEIPEIYLNDSIACIKRSTGLRDLSGKVKKITESTLVLRCGSKNLYVDPERYYLFRKHRVSRGNNREFFEHLLTKI